MEPGNPDYCNQSATFKGSAESMIAIDPTNPAHLVGTSQLFHNYDRGGSRFSAFDGVEISPDGGTSWSNSIIPGFECTHREKITNQTIYRTTDPVVAFGPDGTLYSAILPVFRTNGVETASVLYAAKSSDGGASWTVANAGNPVFNGLATPYSFPEPDKPWIITDVSPTSRFRGTIYIAWTAFEQAGTSAILISKSTDAATSFTAPVTVTPPGALEYQFAIPAVAADGTLYVSFIQSCASCSTFDEMVAKSSDGGDSFSSPVTVGSFRWHSYPNTTFRAGIYESFTVNPVNGHPLLAVANSTKIESLATSSSSLRSDIFLYESSDNGQTWKTPLVVNDNAADSNTFQPVVSVSPNGLVAVSYYDRRLPCPNEPWVLPEDVGKSNFCIDTSIQLFSDQDSLNPIGSNIRVTKFTWDPDNSGSLGGKAVPLPFIGDYFGLALTNTTVYPFFAANYDLGGNPSYDIQIFLGRIDLAKINSSAPILTVVWIFLAAAIAAVVIVAAFYLIRRKEGLRRSIRLWPAR
jgi:hypothetical protein